MKRFFLFWRNGDGLADQGLVASALLIAALVAVGRLASAFREIAIAARYGVSEVVDAYQLATTIATWLPLMIVSVMLVVFVPNFVHLHADRARYREFSAQSGLVVVGLALLVGPATYLFASQFADLLGESSSTATMTAQMTRQLWPISMMIIVGGFLTARLQARRAYWYSGTDALPASLIALFVIAAGTFDDAGPLIMGTLLGFAFQLFALVMLARRFDPPVVSTRLGAKSPEWGHVSRSLVLMAAGQFVIALSIPIDQAFAARVGDGSIAVLGYANRLITLFTGIATLVIAPAILPVFARAHADRDEDLWPRCLRYASLMLLGGTVLAALCWWLAPAMIKLVFERGMFGAADTAAVASAFRYGILQVIPYFAGLVLVQLFAAARSYVPMLMATVAALVAKIALNGVLVPTMGVQGITLSTSAMYLVSSSVMLLIALVMNQQGRLSMQRGRPLE